MSKVKEEGTERAVVKTTLRIPGDIHELVEACAASVGSSVNAWVVSALAQRVRNWRHPISGELIRETIHGKTGEAAHPLADWTCMHAAHEEPLPAQDCPARENAKHRLSWTNPETSLTFDAWALDNGVPIPGRE